MDDQKKSLRSAFDKGMALYTEVTESDSADEKKVQMGIMFLEDATRMVSALDLFSRNETAEELSTGSLRFMMLPAMLGDLTAKLKVNQLSPEGAEQRMQMLDVIQAYYVDFLRRLKDYRIIKDDFKIPQMNDSDDEEDEEGEEKAKPIASRAPDLAAMSRERDEKIARFKAKKELDSRLKELKPLADKWSSTSKDDVGGNDVVDVDDEVVREFYIKLLQSTAFRAAEEVSFCQMEKPLLKRSMKHPTKSKSEVDGGAGSEARAAAPRLKPIIITRDAVQKEVFGLGYKNVPIYSIEEFYEQRVRDGWFPSQAQVAENKRSLLERANLGPEVQRAEEEAEVASKEDKVERDDPEELARARALDEFRDDHRRGEGNRHNKG